MTEVLYNVTVNVSDEVHDEWVDWMRAVHIPEVLASGLFTSAKFLRVHAFEQGGKTYATQYAARRMEDYETYLKDHAPGLRAKTQAAFGDHVHAFRTLLEVLNTFEVR
jgi:hypothetical protein